MAARSSDTFELLAYPIRRAPTGLGRVSTILKRSPDHPGQIGAPLPNPRLDVADGFPRRPEPKSPVQPQLVSLRRTAALPKTDSLSKVVGASGRRPSREPTQRRVSQKPEQVFRVVPHHRTEDQPVRLQRPRFVFGDSDQLLLLHGLNIRPPPLAHTALIPSDYPPGTRPRAFAPVDGRPPVRRLCDKLGPLNRHQGEPT